MDPITMIVTRQLWKWARFHHHRLQLYRLSPLGGMMKTLISVIRANRTGRGKQYHLPCIFLFYFQMNSKRIQANNFKRILHLHCFLYSLFFFVFKQYLMFFLEKLCLPFLFFSFTCYLFFFNFSILIFINSGVV